MLQRLNDFAISHCHKQLHSSVSCEEGVGFKTTSLYLKKKKVELYFSSHCKLNEVIQRTTVELQNQRQWKRNKLL